MINIDPQIQSEPEPGGYEFGYYTFDLLPTLEVTNVETTKRKSVETQDEDDHDENYNRRMIFGKTYSVRLKRVIS